MESRTDNTSLETKKKGKTDIPVLFILAYILTSMTRRLELNPLLFIIPAIIYIFIIYKNIKYVNEELKNRKNPDHIKVSFLSQIIYFALCILGMSVIVSDFYFRFPEAINFN